MRLFNLEDIPKGELFDVDSGNLFDSSVLSQLDIGCIVGVIASEKCYNGEINMDILRTIREYNDIKKQLNLELEKISDEIKSTVEQINKRIAELNVKFTIEEQIKNLAECNTFDKYTRCLCWDFGKVSGSFLQKLIKNGIDIDVSIYDEFYLKLEIEVDAEKKYFDTMCKNHFHKPWEEVIFLNINFIKNDKLYGTLTEFLLIPNTKTKLKIGDQISFKFKNIKFIPLKENPKHLSSYLLTNHGPIWSYNAYEITSWGGVIYSDRNKVLNLLKPGNVIRVQMRSDSAGGNTWYMVILKINNEWIYGISNDSYKIYNETPLSKYEQFHWNRIYKIRPCAIFEVASLFNPDIEKNLEKLLTNKEYSNTCVKTKDTYVL